MTWKDIGLAAPLDVLEDIRPIEKLDVSDLEAYQERTGFALPASYRNFMMMYGPGKIRSDISIFPPTYPKERYPTFSLEAIEERWRRVDVSESTGPERARRLRLFAFSNYNDHFGWDPTEVTDGARNEYAIYLITRDDQHVVRAAASFPEFVEDVCIGDALAQHLGGPHGDEDEESPREFDPG